MTSRSTLWSQKVRHHVKTYGKYVITLKSMSVDVRACIRACWIVYLLNHDIHWSSTVSFDSGKSHLNEHYEYESNQISSGFTPNADVYLSPILEPSLSRPYMKQVSGGWCLERFLNTGIINYRGAVSGVGIGRMTSDRLLQIVGSSNSISNLQQNKVRDKRRTLVLFKSQFMSYC